MLFEGFKHKHTKQGIYRGFGGTGDSSSNTALSEVAALGQEVLAAQAVVAVLVTEAETAQAAAEAAQALAETAQTAAELAETNAETAETNAETAETNAEAAQTAAEAAQTAAEAAQTAAEVAQAASEASETAAASSASAASSSASAASTSASNAATSASNASTSASSAATAQAAAEAAQAAAEDVFTQFGDQYLGPFASDPTLDNSGNALTTGDIYFNTTNNVLKFYSGAAWVAPESVATTAAAEASASATAAAGSATAAAASAAEAATYVADQTGNAGKFLTTDGTDVSWAVVDALPDQTGNAGKFLTTDGTDPSWADSGGGFASGTKMMFVQTAAPTGWTKDTTHDNKALRVVSGTASTGGTVAFTTAFASQAVSGTVGSTTLSISQIPSHNHYVGSRGLDGNGPNLRRDVSYSDWNYVNDLYTGANGGSGSHNHSFSGTAIDMAVQYVDVIIATKD